MKRLYSLRKNSALAAILFTALLTRTTQAETEIDNEFWISTNTNTANLGTLDNPFDGSTATKFDSVMNGMPLNSTIHILAGTYQTRGYAGWEVRSGQKILGSGMDITVLQLVSGAPSEEMVGTVIAPCTNIEVADLTCDCNYTSGPYTYCGVEIEGTGAVVRRVKVINQACFGPVSDGETWGISVYGYRQANCVGNIIEDCEVSHFAGGPISALSMSGCSGVIRDNHVLLALTPGGPPVTGGADQGINGSEATSVLIEGNYVNGADSGVYGDTSGCTNIIIAHNQLINCEQGITYYGSQRRNITIAYNVIDISSNGLAAFNLWNGSNPDVSITNVIITGNTIDLSPQYSGTPFVIGASNVTGLLFYGNTINGILASNQMVEGTARFLGNKNVYMYDNYDLFGNPLTTFCQSPPYTKSFSILPPDAYVQPWGSGSVTIGQLLHFNSNHFYGWICSTNADASIEKSLPFPDDFWNGKTNLVTSWTILTTVPGNYIFNIGEDLVTNGVSGLVQQTTSFTAPTGTNITTIAVTNTLPTPEVEDLQTFIWTGYQVQPGRYTILRGKVTAQ
jgi:Right handed beta helix region